MHGPAFVLPRAGAQPVFVDPHGHRLRRLRHGVRALAAAAVVYLGILALGLAGPATPPFSLFPGAGGTAGESGAEAVRTGSGATAKAGAVAHDLTGGPAQGGAAGGAAPAAIGSQATPAGPAGAPSGPAAPAGPAATPASPAAAPGSAPSAAPAGPGGPASHGAPAPSGSPTPSPSNGRSGPPPRSTSPPPPPPAAQGTPSGHVPPGQAKKAQAAPANHGQQMAAQHSRSPNQ